MFTPVSNTREHLDLRCEYRTRQPWGLPQNRTATVATCSQLAFLNLGNFKLGGLRLPEFPPVGSINWVKNTCKENLSTTAAYQGPCVQFQDPQRGLQYGSLRLGRSASLPEAFTCGDHEIRFCWPCFLFVSFFETGEPMVHKFPKYEKKKLKRLHPPQNPEGKNQLPEDGDATCYI